MVQNSLTMSSHFSRIFSAVFPKVVLLLPAIVQPAYLLAHWLVAYLLLATTIACYHTAKSYNWPTSQSHPCSNAICVNHPQKMIINSIQLFSGMCGACVEAQVMFSSI